MARKRLSVQQAPNILTIALKRFQVRSVPVYQLFINYAFRVQTDIKFYFGKSILLSFITDYLNCFGQSGRSNKLNKRVSFPETLDLRSYMNELEDGNDIYKLYAVIVHLEMLNSFGHYICYVKDFCGIWYRIDDDKVLIPTSVCMHRSNHRLENTKSSLSFAFYGNPIVYHFVHCLLNLILI